MIERLGENSFGFSVWKLFTVNYFRCYEVSIHLIKYKIYNIFNNFI